MGNLHGAKPRPLSNSLRQTLTEPTVQMATGHLIGSTQNTSLVLNTIPEVGTAAPQDGIVSHNGVGNLLVKFLHPEAKLPIRGSSLAIGYDLYAIAEQEIESRTRALVPIGIAIALPSKTYG